MAAENFDEARLGPSPLSITRWLSETTSLSPMILSELQANLSTDLFNSCVEILPALIPLQRQWNPKQRAQFAESHSYLCLWMDNVSSGRVALCFHHSPDLYRSILDLLYDIGMALTQFFGATLELLYETPLQRHIVEQKFENMEDILLEAVTILQPDDLSMNSDFDETDSDSEEEEGEEDAGEEDAGEELNDISRVEVEIFLRTLQTRTRLLMETCPTLEQTTSTEIKSDNELGTELEKFKVSYTTSDSVPKVHDGLSRDNLIQFGGLTDAVRRIHKRPWSEDSIPDETGIPEDDQVSKFHDSALGPSLPSTSRYATSALDSVPLALTRHHIPRKTTFCEFCNDQPSGFHGDHELRRHIERHHTQIRRVWVCRDASTDGTFLANCKSCRNMETYGAVYNAAAHLRRAHFNPCKNQRGRQNKKSEGRREIGFGNSPSMEYLKNWMCESLEIRKGDKVILAPIAMEPNVR